MTGQYVVNVTATVTAESAQSGSELMPEHAAKSGARLDGDLPAQASQSSGTTTTAKSYMCRGWHVFPGQRGKKTPTKGWPWTKKRLSLADAPEYFDRDQHNVLVALGSASGDLTDIDLDWIEATAAADLVMSQCPSFGRSGKPRSHRLVICSKVKLESIFSRSPLPSIRGSAVSTRCASRKFEALERIRFSLAVSMRLAKALNGRMPLPPPSPTSKLLRRTNCRGLWVFCHLLPSACGFSRR